jgi:hypothetical protein
MGKKRATPSKACYFVSLFEIVLNKSNFMDLMDGDTCGIKKKLIETFFKNNGVSGNILSFPVHI